MLSGACFIPGLVGFQPLLMFQSAQMIFESRTYNIYNSVEAIPKAFPPIQSALGGGT